VRRLNDARIQPAAAREWRLKNSHAPSAHFEPAAEQNMSGAIRVVGADVTKGLEKPANLGVAFVGTVPAKADSSRRFTGCRPVASADETTT